MSKPDDGREAGGPDMSDILASIRKIIADDPIGSRSASGQPSPPMPRDLAVPTGAPMRPAAQPSEPPGKAVSVDDLLAMSGPAAAPRLAVPPSAPAFPDPPAAPSWLFPRPVGPADDGVAAPRAEAPAPPFPSPIQQPSLPVAPPAGPPPAGDLGRVIPTHADQRRMPDLTPPQPAPAAPPTEEGRPARTPLIDRLTAGARSLLPDAKTKAAEPIPAPETPTEIVRTPVAFAPLPPATSAPVPSAAPPSDAPPNGAARGPATPSAPVPAPAVPAAAIPPKGPAVPSPATPAVAASAPATAAVAPAPAAPNPQAKAPTPTAAQPPAQAAAPAPAPAVAAPPKAAGQPAPAAAPPPKAAQQPAPVAVTPPVKAAQQPAPVAANPPPKAAAQPAAGRSMEETVSELLRPLLREWLDANMPRVLEAALKAELASRQLPGDGAKKA